MLLGNLRLVILFMDDAYSFVIPTMKPLLWFMIMSVENSTELHLLTAKSVNYGGWLPFMMEFIHNFHSGYFDCNRFFLNSCIKQ